MNSTMHSFFKFNTLRSLRSQISIQYKLTYICFHCQVGTHTLEIRSNRAGKWETQMQRVLLRLLILVLLSGLVELKFTFTIPDNPNCLSDASGRFFCHSPPPPCQSMRHHYDLRQKETVGYRSFLLYGHNGLRNRLAIKLNTVDMLHVTWDDKLAELSNRHHRHCHRQMHDSQEETINNSDEWMLYRRVFSGKNNLSRNSFFWPNIYLNNILETAVGTWYSRHQQLKYPKEIKYKERDYLVINGDNSFTHIINPQTYRMGCSYAKYAIYIYILYKT